MPRAEVAKLADALDLGSSAARRAGSIPVLGTIQHLSVVGGHWSITTYLRPLVLFVPEFYNCLNMANLAPNTDR